MFKTKMTLANNVSLTTLKAEFRYPFGWILQNQQI